MIFCFINFWGAILWCMLSEHLYILRKTNRQTNNIVQLTVACNRVQQEIPISIDMPH